MKNIIYIICILTSVQTLVFSQADVIVDEIGILGKRLSIANTSFSSNNEVLIGDHQNDGNSLMSIKTGGVEVIHGIDASLKGITGTTTAHKFEILSNNLSKITIDAGGDVGIGQTNPGATLHVTDPGVANVPIDVVVLESNTSNRPGILFSEGGTGAGKTMGIIYNGSGTGNSEMLQFVNSNSNPIVSWTNQEFMGIGTTNPRGEVDVQGNILLGTTPGSVILENSVADASLTHDGKDLLLNNPAGALEIKANRRVLLTALGDDVILDAKSQILFQKLGQNTMRCDQNGHWAMTNITPTARFHIKQNAAALPSIMIENNDDADTWDFEVDISVLQFAYNDIFKAFWNTNGSYILTSDRRLKEQITPLKDGVLKDILKLKPSKYFYNRNENVQQKSIGFIAQDFQEYFPELVKENDEEENDYLAINYAGISTIAVKGIQEQQVALHELKAEIDNQTVNKNDIHQASTALIDLEKRIKELKK